MKKLPRSTPGLPTPPPRAAAAQPEPVPSEPVQPEPVPSERPTFASFVAMLGIEIGQALDGKSGVLDLEFNGVSFVVAYDPDTWGEGQVAFVCELGKVPHENRCAILEAVLGANLDLHGAFSPVFAMRPMSDLLVSIMVLPLELLDADTTLQTLVRYTVVVDRWHADHFIESPDA